MLWTVLLTAHVSIYILYIKKNKFQNLNPMNKLVYFPRSISFSLSLSIFRILETKCFRLINFPFLIFFSLTFSFLSSLKFILILWIHSQPLILHPSFIAHEYFEREWNAINFNRISLLEKICSKQLKIVRSSFTNGSISFRLPIVSLPQFNAIRESIAFCLAWNSVQQVWK